MWWKIPAVIVGSLFATMLVAAVVAIVFLVLTRDESSANNPDTPRYAAAQVANVINQRLAATVQATRAACPPHTLQGRRGPLEPTATPTPPLPAGCVNTGAGIASGCATASYKGQGLWQCGPWAFDERNGTMFLNVSPTPRASAAGG